LGDSVFGASGTAGIPLKALVTKFRAVRVGVVDIGTNSTRLLVAEIGDGRLVRELERLTEVTRLGEGVDGTGRLSDAGIERVLAVCERFRRVLDEHGADLVVGVLTSAVRDASNGADLERELRERFGFDAQTIPGEREAWLTYLGATGWREAGAPVLVIDIGGGSTELIVGSGSELDFFVSTQVGSVRFTERYLHSDPPRAEELDECGRAVRAELEQAVPEEVRRAASEGIAVAGTPTSLAAIDLCLDPYDRERVQGHRLSLEAVERMIGELAAMPLAERREVTGLHPDRAPTIVAGAIILREAMRVFGLDQVEVSERDLLEGAAVEAAAGLWANGTNAT
jgi:exopolyphosphatase/guanosine-5'-triphosphate,3'-diphosphate pyrophosphatase